MVSAVRPGRVATMLAVSISVQYERVCMRTRTGWPRSSRRRIQKPSSWVMLYIGICMGSPLNEPLRARSWPPLTRLIQRTPFMPARTAAASYWPRGTEVLGESRPIFP